LLQQRLDPTASKALQPKTISAIEAGIDAMHVRSGPRMFVATPMLEYIEIVSLHDDDKVASSAVGNLVRTEDKTEINHFPEGQALLKKVCRARIQI
jgi:methylthioribose-1-phosphate isomerase